MKVTKDIVRDLLPAYLAGEASAETRAVVEEYLAKYADLRRIVEAARADSPSSVAAPVSLEIRRLERMQRLLALRNFWLGFALIFCLAAPIVRPLRLADLVMLIGMAGWVPFLIACKELTAAGPGPARGWGPRHRWLIAGGLVGFAFALLAEQNKGWRHSSFDIGYWMFLTAANSGFAAVFIGEGLHRLQSAADLRGPYISTLFGKEEGLRYGKEPR
jgi:hypothetical protein